MKDETLEIIAKSIDPSMLMVEALESIEYDRAIVEKINAALGDRLARFVAGKISLTEEQADAIAEIFPDIPKRLWLGRTPK